MAYRFLTEQEFKDKDRWSYDYQYPKGWNEIMLKYLGQTIPEHYWEHCERGLGFSIRDTDKNRDWSFVFGEYCIAEQSESQSQSKSKALRFKVGDLVFIDKNSPHASQGMLDWKLLKGTVTHAYLEEEAMYSYCYRVKWENGNDNSYRESDLIPYTTLDSLIKYKFNIGDKVKVVASGNGFNPAAIGAVATITNHDKYKNGPGYIITWPELHRADIDKYWFNGPDESHGEESFELYQEETYHKSEHLPGVFQIGDFIVSLIDVKGHRNIGEIFVAKSFTCTPSNEVYYKDDCNGSIKSFRKAYPHEIPRHLTAPMHKPLPKALYEDSSPKKEDIKLIEPVHSVSVKLRTKKNKFKF
jgi:hypothetical protein